MDEFLVASNLVLWAGLILLAGLVYALARQVGALFERIAPAGALMVNEVLKPGDPAPEVTVETLNGATLTLGGAPESGAWPRATLIFFLAPDCPVCKTLLPVLGSVAKSESWVDIVLASDGGSAGDQGQRSLDPQRPGHGNRRGAFAHVAGEHEQPAAPAHVPEHVGRPAQRGAGAVDIDALKAAADQLGKGK